MVFALAEESAELVLECLDLFLSLEGPKVGSVVFLVFFEVDGYSDAFWLRNLDRFLAFLLLNNHFSCWFNNFLDNLLSLG